MTIDIRITQMLLASKLDCSILQSTTRRQEVAIEMAKRGRQHLQGAIAMMSGLRKFAAVSAAVIGIAAGSASVYAADKDIVGTAVAAGQFKTLAAALTAAGLVDTLKGPGPFTVFAPTDAAFAALPGGTVDSLLKPENKAKLTAILTYHVVAGKVMAADVVKLKEAKTVNGAMVAVKVDGGNVMTNNAKVATADIEASNGVIHVIDTVLLPPAN
jgi:uncharacterized surface protein with fasciclin (FAS1) repeats